MSATQQAGIELPEGAFRETRIEFVEETFRGYTPDNPAWRPVSDGIRTFNPGYGHELSEDAYLGMVDYRRRVMSESHEPELTYAMQRGNWIYDTNGDRQNLAAWGFDRPSNLLAPSLTVVRRQSAGTANRGSNPASTINARYNPAASRDGSDSTGKAFRVFDVLRGVHISEAAIVAENGESTVNNEVTGMGQRGRMHHIDQPLASTTLTVRSTDAGDTDYQVSIESEDGATSVTYTLDATDATTPVSDTDNTEFTDIDAITITDPNGDPIDDTNSYAGRIVVAIDDGDPAAAEYTPTEGEWLFVGFGADSYDGAPGDRGVPTLGTGSHAGSISAAGDAPDFYVPEDLGIQRPVGVNLDVVGVVQTIKISVENDIEQIEGGARDMISLPGMRDIEVTVSLTGETITPALQTAAVVSDNDTTRTLFDPAGAEYIDFLNAPLEETDAEDEGGEPITQREATFRPQAGPDGESAIDISSASA